MTISAHAIRRYKKRIGNKTSSKKRVIAQICRDLARDVKYKKRSHVPNHYILVTSKYQAVCCGTRVVTITELSKDATNIKEGDVESEELAIFA